GHRGLTMARVRVQTEDFDIGRELDALTRGRTDVGGLASFVGLVRAANDGQSVSGMTLEHYPGMTEKALEACEFIMDYLKTRAPFWKKEDTAEGGRWVEARASDDKAAGRWKGWGREPAWRPTRSGPTSASWRTAPTS